jgi:hypothetical protein
MTITGAGVSKVVASSHPPTGTAATGVSPEFFFVLFFDLRRHHGLRKGQRQRIAAIGRGLTALLHVRRAFEHRAPHRQYTLNRPHPNPSPVSDD